MKKISILTCLILLAFATKTSAQDSPNYEQEVCINYVIDLIRSTSAFQNQTAGLNEKIKKNGGISFGFKVEASPLPDTDNAELYAENIEISLHENYPNRMPIIARYVYVVKENNLYQVDNVEGELILLELDPSSIYPTKCKTDASKNK